ncbi:MFS general substrate transporter [Jackrogersella minutella]|nr:MFS general substrate transporter [Jackrogersella minutella]
MPKNTKYSHTDRGDGAQTHPLTTTSHPRDKQPAWEWKALLVANCFLTIIVGYDASNVANIQASVYKAFGHIDILPWVALAYSVCNIALIPLGRKLFKLCDFRVLYNVPMLFLIAGSAMSGSATGIGYVIAGRAVMALGSSIILQGIMNFNIIFTYPRELGLVQGCTGACFAIGLVLGPIIGGAFANNEHTTWRWGFYLVIPLSAISLILQVLCCPSYRIPTNKTGWQSIKEFDHIGNILHTAVCMLFPISCMFLGSIGTWGITSAIATWTVFTFAMVLYAIQQSYSIGTTPENRFLSPCSLLNNRTVLLTWICTMCAAACYGVALYYVPIYFAFSHGLDPLATGIRLMPFIGVFVVTVIVCGVLLSAVRRYKPFFLVGSALLLIGGGLFQTLTIETSESAVMGFETIIAAGLGMIWQLAVPVCSAFLPGTEDRLDLTVLVNMAQLGGIAASLSIAGMIYQSTGFESLKVSVSNSNIELSEDAIRELLAGVASPILLNGDPEITRLVTSAITDAIKNCLLIVLAFGGLSLLAASTMKWEALQFKKPTREQIPKEIGHNRQRVQRSDNAIMLDDLVIQRETPASGSASQGATQAQGQR